ncbi:unnamed protein product [Closterium sp. NIES-54]
MVTTTTIGGQRVAICTCTRTGRHLTTFTRRPGSSLYTLTTEPAQVAASGQVSELGQVAAHCSCRLLSHQTLLWHHRLGHPSLPRLRGMHSCLLVSGLPRSLPPLPPSPAPPCLPCVEGWQRRSSLILVSPDDCSPADSPYGPRLQLREWFREDLSVLRLHSDRGGEFSSDLLGEFCRGEGILQSSTSGPVWGSRAFVRDTSADKLSSRAIPCVFLGFPPDAPGWQFYHPTSRRVLPSQDVTLDESVPFYCLFPYRTAPLPPPPLFLARGPPSVDPLPPQGPAPSGVSHVDPLPLAEPVEVTIDSGAAGGGAARGAASGGAEPVGVEPGGAELASAELGGAEPEGAEPGGAETEGVEPGGAESEGVELGGAEPRGTASAGGPAGASPRYSHRREPLSLRQLREWFARRTHLRSGTAGVGGPAAGGTVAGGAGATNPGGAGVTVRAGGARATSLGGAGAAGPGGARTRGTGAGDLGAGGIGGGGAGAGGVGAGDLGAGGAGAGGAGAGGTGAGDPGAGGTGAGDPGAGGTSAGGAGAGGARAGSTGAGGAGAGGAGAGGARAGGTGAGGAGAEDLRAGGAGAGGAGAGGTGAGGTVQLRPLFVPLPPPSLTPPGSVLRQVLSLPSSAGLPPSLLSRPAHQLQPELQPYSPLPAPSPYAEQTDSLTERCEPESRPALSVRAVRTGCRVPRPRAPPVPGTHIMALRPSFVPLQVPLPSPPSPSLADGSEPESNLVLAASLTITRLLATIVTDPLFESAAASALVAELVEIAATCRLDYAASLVAESESVCPPSVGGECALGTDVLEDRLEDFECLVAAVPHLVARLLAPEGDSDAPDIPTPRFYAEAITGPYSSEWQTAMDAEMASWKSTGTYVDGMWIFRVKRSPGSPPVFKARYVARGFSQRQGFDLFQTFSPTLKMTTLQVLLHVAAQRDYELHSLDFSTTFLQGSLHEDIWLRRPPGFTGSFPAGLHLRLWGLLPSTADPSLFLRTDTSLPPFYVLVYIDDLVFAPADTEALTLLKSELQKRHTCTDLGELRDYLCLQITRDRALRTITLTQSHMVHQVLQRFGFQFSSPQPTPLSTSHSL